VFEILEFTADSSGKRSSRVEFTGNWNTDDKAKVEEDHVDAKGFSYTYDKKAGTIDVDSNYLDDWSDMPFAVDLDKKMLLLMNGMVYTQVNPADDSGATGGNKAGDTAKVTAGSIKGTKWEMLFDGNELDGGRSFSRFYVFEFTTDSRGRYAARWEFSGSWEELDKEITIERFGGAEAADFTYTYGKQAGIVSIDGNEMPFTVDFAKKELMLDGLGVFTLVE
jgi:hypothetical protein